MNDVPDGSSVGPDHTRIDLEQPYDRRYWTGRLGVTEEVLRRAVSRVGVQASKVHEYLRGPTH
jgi:hypothetical protein